MAEKITGVNRATVQRNFALFEARDLMREVTGQGRYRVWTARLQACPAPKPRIDDSAIKP